MRDARASLGQAMVEFALLTPVFFMLTVAIIDVGRAFYAYNGAAHAAREGARYAAVNGGSQNPGFDWVGSFNGNTPGVYGFNTAYPINGFLGTPTIVGTVATAAKGINLDELVVTVAAPGSTGPSPNTPIQVRLDYVFQPGTTVLTGGMPITVTSSSTMIIE